MRASWRRRHTSVVVTGTDPARLQQLQHLLRTPYYHVWTSTDLIGVETCVALRTSCAGGGSGGGGLLGVTAWIPTAVMHNLAARRSSPRGCGRRRTWCGTWAAICAASTRCRAGIST
ncbi:MAG: hypothetical protein R3A10_09910 [Caldilineaceae bacterium]